MTLSSRYASEHVISADLKTRFRDIIRNNRRKHHRHDSPENLSVIERCTNMWWNPSQSKRIVEALRARASERAMAPIQVRPSASETATARQPVEGVEEELPEEPCLGCDADAAVLPESPRSGAADPAAQSPPQEKSVKGVAPSMPTPGGGLVAETDTDDWAVELAKELGVEPPNP